MNDPVCERCEWAKPRPPSAYCQDCNKTIDRIILRALDGGDCGADELASMYNLSIDAVYTRRRKLQLRGGL